MVEFRLTKVFVIVRRYKVFSKDHWLLVLWRISSRCTLVFVEWGRTLELSIFWLSKAFWVCLLKPRLKIIFYLNFYLLCAYLLRGLATISIIRRSEKVFSKKSVILLHKWAKLRLKEKTEEGSSKIYSKGSLIIEWNTLPFFIYEWLFSESYSCCHFT